MKIILGKKYILKDGFLLFAGAKGSGQYLLFLLLFLPVITFGQAWIPHFDHIGTKEGLSGEVITALCQDRRGFLWIGTNGQGLNRYDGNEIKVFRHSKRDSFSLCNDLVWSIVEDEQGLLWIGTQNGVSRLNPFSGRCDNYFKDDDSIPKIESYLFRDTKNFIWSTSAYGLSRFNPKANRFERHLALNGSGYFNKPATGSNGLLWLGGPNGVTAFDPLTGSFRHFYPFPNEPKAEKNGARVKIDPYGNIWVFCWGGGLQRFHPETGLFERFIWNKNPRFPGNANIPFDVEETFDGEGKRIFWVCAEHGAFRFPLEAHDFPSLDKPHTLLLPGSEINPAGWQARRLISDYRGNLWFGTIHGLYRYKKEQEYARLVQCPGEASIGQVVFTQNGEALIASVLKRPLMILDARQQVKKAFQNLPPGSKEGAGEACMAAAKDEEDGLIYAATAYGLVAYDEKSGKTRWRRWNPRDNTGLASPKITRILPLGKGQLLLAFWRNGLQIFDTRRGKGVWRYLDPGKNAWCLKRIDGVIWVGTEYALYTFDPQKRTMTEMAPPEPPGIPIVYYDVIKDQQGRIWAGTNYGLCQINLQNPRLPIKYTSEEGLAATEVNTMAEDSLGRLWLGTPGGLRVFDPNTRKFHILDKEIWPLGSIWRAPNGKFWLTTARNKILIFDPSLVRSPRPSRLYITGLKINEQDSLPDIPFEHIPQIRLQPGQNALTFSYTAIDLDDFGKTLFRYRLEGLQTDWVKAGKNRQAAFVNLKPGVYTFRVRPEDAGDDAFYDATLKVIVTDYFWQRLWFKAAAFAVLSGLLISLLFLDYTRRLRARNVRLRARLAVEDERNRISRDLHDDLGSGLGAISLLSDIALSKTSSKEMRSDLVKIAESARESSEKIHEIIWATNPKNDTLEHLIGYLHRYAVSLFADSAYDIHAKLPEFCPAVTIAGEHRRALFLAYKEALNNIARHAQATRVDIEYICSFTRLEIHLRDNGRGFDLTAVSDAGNGLVNMQKRMEDIGGSFRVASGAGGTTVRFEVEW